MTGSSGIGWTRSYEPQRNLIAAISNYWNSSSVSSFAYENDALGRRTRRLDTAPALSATNVFAYNRRSEVTNAAMHAATYSYSYDDIGNRKASSVNSVGSSYTANSLNQYTAIAGALACSPEYDLDGNMTWDGRLIHTWDAENRLTKSEPGGIATNGAVMVDNVYDYQNRRIRKVVKQLSGRDAGYPMNPEASPGAWGVIETRHYAWDGWNIAAEVVIDSAACSTNIHYYTWGLDLSGSIQGAGGVGGLLADTKVSASATATYFPCSDANGNVTEYVDDDGTAVAHYEYSAFGETTAKSGSMADDFTHRFSTKPFEVETGYSKYQQRDYIPPLARWASRDPIGVEGGLNAYCFVKNEPNYHWDYCGLIPITVTHIYPDATKWNYNLKSDDWFKSKFANADFSFNTRTVGWTEYVDMKVTCSCDCVRDENNRKRARKINCSVTWNANIYLRESLIPDLEWNWPMSLEGAMGHEQRHLKGAAKLVERKINKPLRTTNPNVQTEQRCNSVADTIGRDYTGRLKALLDSGKQRHRDKNLSDSDYSEMPDSVGFYPPL